MRISERLLTVLVCCLLAAAIPAFARGSGERELKQAQALLEEKRYAQAMALVIEIMKQYPDLREATDKIVARVMEVRRIYNQRYAELLNVLNVEQDVEKGLAIIKELQDLDPNPDPAIKRSLAAAQRALIRTGEYQKFTVVMKSAAAEIAEGKEAQAIGTYLSGFAISRAEFDAAPYSALHREQALASVKELENAAHLAAASLPGVVPLPAALVDLLKTPVTDSRREAFLRTLQPLAQVRELEAEIRTLAVRVREVNIAIDAANGDAEPNDLWLHFVEQYALGRPNLPSEGLAHAARQPWVAAARKLSGAATTASDAAYQAMEKAFAGATEFAEFRSLTTEARNRGLLALAMLEAETPSGKPAEGLVLGSADTARAAELLALAERTRRHVADADAWEAFAAAEDAANSALAGLQRSLSGVPSAPDGNALRRGRADVAALRESALRGESEWSVRTANAASGSVMAARSAAVRDGFAALAARAIEADAGLAARIAGLESATFQPVYAAAQARQQKGRALAAGSTAGSGPMDRRPELADDEYVRALSDLEALRNGIDAWRVRWTSEPDHVSSSAGIVGLVADQDGLRERIVELQAALAVDRSAAATAIGEATQFRGQGDSAFLAAQTHEKEKRYAEAQNEYNTALQSYGDSLKRQEHAATRIRYNDLPRIIAAVKQLALRQILADVEVQVNRGIAEYKNADFPTAVATLEAAKARWDRENPNEPNETLEYYLGLARSAQKLSGRREITRTDPLYEDIRGFMTQAELSYNEAARLRKTSPSSAEYAKSISAAKASVEAITTAVPEYREARLMDLKIERLNAGETAFVALLRQRVTDSLAKSRDPRATEVTMRDTRLALMDYQGIEGVASILTATVRRQIDAAVVDLEVRLGMRAKERSPEDIRRSAELFQQASAMYRRNPNDQTLWDPVLLALRQSLAANPDNADASKLRNEVIAKRGGSTEDLLSPAEQEQYLAAINAFARNDLPRAQAIVDTLIALKPKNPGLLTLKAQIQRARGE